MWWTDTTSNNENNSNNNNNNNNNNDDDDDDDDDDKNNNNNSLSLFSDLTLFVFLIGSATLMLSCWVTDSPSYVICVYYVMMWNIHVGDSFSIILLLFLYLACMFAVSSVVHLLINNNNKK